jgi:glycosyltransferase involved in cell wall biosynthesis
VEDAAGGLGRGPAGSAVPYAIVAADFVRTGGMDRANLALASYLVGRGHSVHIVGHRADAELLAQPRVHFHRVSKPLNSFLLGGPLLARAGRRVGREVAAAGGRVVVNGGNCSFGDVNWVHYVHAAYEPTGAHGVARRLKNAAAHRFYLAAEAKCLKAARILIANSNRTRQDLIDRLDIPAERIHTVYLGIDAAAFVPPTEQQRIDIRRRLGWAADRPVAIFVGALGDRRKGFDTLFSAWLRLCEARSWDADLVVVGAGGELAAWKERAARAGLESRVRFLGFRKDVPELLRGADVLVSPTRYESYGLGVQEAICCGVPALVSAEAGVAERYPLALRPLLLPDCEDVAELVGRLLAWRTDMPRFRGLAKLLGEQLRLRTWEQTALEMVELVEKSASPPGPA